MIFRQYHEILSGLKTETRRIHRPRMTVGRDYAMVPKRGAPAWWFGHDDNIVGCVTNPREIIQQAYGRSTPEQGTVTSKQVNDIMRMDGYVQCRIRVLSIHQEPLFAIDHIGAAAEGVETRHDYAVLWEAINGSGSWRQNPDVWVIRFEVLPEVARLYALWRAQEDNDA